MIYMAGREDRYWFPGRQEGRNGVDGPRNSVQLTACSISEEMTRLSKSLLSQVPDEFHYILTFMQVREQELLSGEQEGAPDLAKWRGIEIALAKRT
jgi:hypothetical protein